LLSSFLVFFVVGRGQSCLSDSPTLFVVCRSFSNTPSTTFSNFVFYQPAFFFFGSRKEFLGVFLPSTIGAFSPFLPTAPIPISPRTALACSPFFLSFSLWPFHKTRTTRRLSSEESGAFFRSRREGRRGGFLVFCVKYTFPFPSYTPMARLQSVPLRNVRISFIANRPTFFSFRSAHWGSSSSSCSSFFFFLPALLTFFIPK